MRGRGEPASLGRRAHGVLVAMSHFDGKRRAFCVRAFYENSRSYIVTRRLYCSEYGLRQISEAPSANLIKIWVQRFEETGSTFKPQAKGRPRTSRTDDNIERVMQSVRGDPQMSTRKRSSVLHLSRRSLQRILNLDLKLHPYKLQLTQELKESDFGARLAFANEMLNRFSNFDNILFSDEAHFHINGFVNRQNCRYWNSENPKLKHQKPLHSPKVTVWAAISGRGIIGPFFFENARGQNVTVNTERYVAMLEGFLAPELENSRIVNSRTWFQQDGATCHTSNDSMAVVKQMFPGRLISKRGDIPWPPRSPDVTPPDFFLWGYLKNKVYSNNPKNIDQLKENIRGEMAAITPALLKKVFNNFRLRLEECRRREGHHLDDVIFKK